MGSSISRFAVAAGSTPGKHHVRAGRNNQDAFHWQRLRGGVVAVVCDGCGSAPSSELGARAGSRLVARVVGEHVDSARLAPSAPELWSRVQNDVIAGLARLASELGGPREQTVHDCLLFTIVGLLWTDDALVTFDAGDGVRALDDRVDRLGPFPSNAPPYLAYALLGHEPTLSASAFDSESASRVLLATDGLAGLEDAAILGLATGELLFTNRDALRRRLVLAARAPGASCDDSTAIVIRRHEQS